jgi:hypothetical protein
MWKNHGEQKMINADRLGSSISLIRIGLPISYSAKYAKKGMD